ncbi:MAG: peptidoglycan DD-metalloendopeptidase family protein, partial [Clostridiales bacterium]|nr:peptidoglycan DD-metalloendopeptidase family protein [Clostridiales bacterium]
MDILQMSISAALLIVAVVILRALTLYRLPKRTFLFLWGVVLCRLLIPFSIPFRFSFYTGVDMLLKKAPAFTMPSAAETAIPAAFPAAAPETAAGAAVLPAGGASPYLAPLLWLWLGGVCACALFFTAGYIRCRREFKTALPVENDAVTAWRRAHPLQRPVQIRQSDKLGAPLTYGVFRPVVLVPKTTDWKDEGKLRYLLAHEYVHIRRFDTLIKLLFTAAVCVHWFNPLVWVMFLLVNRDIELACDEAVLRESEGGTKSDYAMTLIGLEEKKTLLTPLCNSFSKNAIEERIKAVMKSRKYTIPAILAAVVIAAAVTLVFATSKTEPGNGAGLRTGASDEEPNGKTIAEITRQIREVQKKTYEQHERLRQILEAAETSVSPYPPVVRLLSEKDWIWPCPDSKTVASRYGMRRHPIYNEYIFKDHIDINADEGSAVVAALGGTVYNTGFDDEQGNYIVIDHGGYITTVYRHLRETLV